RRGPELDAIARAAGASLLFSGAVGGSTPAIELIDSATSEGDISRIDGVLNGTTSFILDEIARGCDTGAAIAEAQRRGYAEADPSLDLSGEDLRHQIAILARRAWGAGARIVFSRRTGLAGVDESWIRAEREAGRIVRLVAEAWPEAGR